MRDFEKHDMTDSFNQDIHSKVLRAGKRTYFFDVKSTRNKEMYLVITESKKVFEDDGNPFYEKHKIFLYREDLDNFREVFSEVSDYITANQPESLHTTEINESVDFGGLDRTEKAPDIPEEEQG